MKSVYRLLRTNKKELANFLKTQPNNKYTFVVRDEKDKTEWINPNVKGDEKSCYVEDCAPFVMYSNDGKHEEYIVSSMTYDEEKEEVVLECYNTIDYDEVINIPIRWLDGFSEFYIFEMMIDLGLV